MREGNNGKSNKFEMEILDEGALDKTLTVTKKYYTPPPPTSWNKIY